MCEGLLRPHTKDATDPLSLHKRRQILTGPQPTDTTGDRRPATESRLSANRPAYTSRVMAADASEHPLSDLDVGSSNDGQRRGRVS